MKIARTIKLAVAAAIAVASVAVPASAQGAVHPAAKAPYLFIYTEPGKTLKEAKPVIMPDELTFTKFNGKPATIEAHKGVRIPVAYTQCPPNSPAKSCFFPGWDPWSVNSADNGADAVMNWAKVGNTIVRTVQPPFSSDQPGDFAKTKLGNWWFYCLDYTPETAPDVFGPAVFLHYSFSEGWKQITEAQLTNTKDCAKAPVLGG
jgi:hypothetical protein